MDFVRLRKTLNPYVEILKNHGTHEDLPDICEEFGLPPPPADGTKLERIAHSFDALPDATLSKLAERLLVRFPPSPQERNEIQDILWSSVAAPEIPKRSRREVARVLSIEDICVDREKFNFLLDSLWVLETHATTVEELLSLSSHSLRSAIEKHVYRNPEDWSVEDLFDKLSALNASNRRFVLFLEGLASADVLLDEPAQRNFVGLVNGPLRACGVELRETGMDGGYPVFQVQSISLTKGRPKNLIFASRLKPDLRFRDAVNNDIEIVTNADKVLVYDRPIPPEGLRWSDLQSWWSETRRIPNDDNAKKTLYARLRESLPNNSPPQALFFNAFYSGFGTAVPNLPALLPEVWLHWDPKTARERGVDALTRFRMDFLLLLSSAVRVVIEVDGMHHYAQPQGRADGYRYAAMVAADRELKLAGYEVYRFGTEELNRNGSKQTVQRFFAALFNRYGVPVNT